MEFPGGSITNIRVIDGFSNIYWRIYTEETSGTNPSGDGANNGPTILKHISRLKELELRLRSLGCLVLSYPRRLGLLIFSATPDFQHLSPILLNEGKDESNRLLVGSTVLKVWTSGSVSSGDLAKSLSSDLQTTSANSPAASQRIQSGSVPPRRVDNSGGSAAIYSSFISAVTAAFSLQIVRHNNAIPLGPRTLFNTVENSLDESQGVLNDGPTSVSALTSLQIQLTSVGKLTIALQTIAQSGLTRLSQPGEEPFEISHFSPGTDLWLAPNGSIARLVTTPLGGDNSPLLNSASEGTNNQRARLEQWKSKALEWLSYFGLPVDLITEEGWVEVEVWEPFWAKLSGETARLKEENSPLPLKRITWPAIYCFRRTKSTLPEASIRMEELSSFDCDPLEFAENWCLKEMPKAVDTKAQPASEHQEQQTNNQGTLSPGPVNLTEGIESLSRASLYPDLQSASLVYPTPPDGTTGIGVNPAMSEDSDHGSNLIRNQARQKHNDVRAMIKGRLDPDMTMEFGPSAGLAVGSGLYDTNDDDDLFGDMNERDFGAKGITDEDFSFFDDSNYSHTRHGANLDNIRESPDFVDTSKPDALEFPEHEAPSPNNVTIDEICVPQPSPEQIPRPPRDQPTSGDSAPILSPRHDEIQTISPPLSPVEVKKILLPESSDSAQPATKTTHVPSYYSPVAFKHNVSSWDKKYGAEGKFSFVGARTSLTKDSYNSSGGIPTIGLPRRRGTVKTFIYPNAADGHGSLPNETPQDLPSSPDSSSETDDESDESGLESYMPSTVVVTPLKRKRARSSPVNSPPPSSEKDPVGPKQEINFPRSEDSVFLGNFLSTFSDWSITGFFSMTENQVFPTLSPREVQVQIAQLLVDQVTQSSLDHKLDGKFGISCLDNRAFCLRELLEGTEFLGGFDKLDLNSFVSLQEQNIPSPAAPNGPTPRQPPHRKEAGKVSILKLSPPHLRVRRGKDFLETLPPAVSFWETFGLEPVHGPKDIMAYCIHPPVAARAADAFLERLSLLYSSCNLGSHTRGDNSDAFDKGLGGWDVTSSKQSSQHRAMQQLKIICEELGTALLNAPAHKDNIVVYILNPFSNAASLVDICAAFWSLLQKFAAGADKQHAKQLDEVVLQIIPIDFVTSAESLVVRPQTDYLNLALEVYSRCAARQIQATLMNCTSPVILAEPHPPSLGFRLASERSSPLQEGKCLHVACSRSQDQRWMSVAWSDNFGVLQRMMSYCLRFRNSNVARNVSTVRGEIWAATKDIMDKHQARWRIIIANTENVDQDEHDAWLNFAEQYNKSRPVPLELTILSVNTTSDLFLSPPPSSIPMGVLNPQASSTPVATPLPSGALLSPDQLGNAPTPPSGVNIPANTPTPTDALFESESDSLLTDVCDESWALVLSHRLNSTLHLTEYRPALASGYLLRRRGPSDTDGAFTMNVNLLYSQRPQSSYDSLLREIIGMYRGLATLARARGTRIVQSGTLPWHIASAVRAQEILSYVL
ncbi:mediator complex subunit 13 C-terminal-domain-containing protein [Aspergillus cavernicola]|uniref:Mediator of RNA polymerase II transcription subunit 13 n=1 Tax=Aspergillus cavernicola TaxID=176166 RepID=A0ABR4IPX8_9EURO